MDSSTIELVFDKKSQHFPNNTLCSFASFLPEQMKWAGRWEVAISDIFYPSIYQYATESKFLLFEEKLAKLTEPYYLQPELTLWRP